MTARRCLTYCQKYCQKKVALQSTQSCCQKFLLPKINVCLTTMECQCWCGSLPPGGCGALPDSSPASASPRRLTRLASTNPRKFTRFHEPAKTHPLPRAHNRPLSWPTARHAYRSPSVVLGGRFTDSKKKLAWEEFKKRSVVRENEHEDPPRSVVRENEHEDPEHGPLFVRMSRVRENEHVRMTCYARGGRGPLTTCCARGGLRLLTSC